VALLGPLADAGFVQLKKEIRLEGKEPRARYRVTVLSAGADPLTYAIRNTARVPARTTLQVEKTDGDLRRLAGAGANTPTIAKSMRYWLIPVPPTAPTNDVVLGAFVPVVEHKNGWGVWTRRILAMPADEKEAPHGCTFLCLLDDKTRSYAASLQGAQAAVDVTHPAVFEEEWSLKKRGR